MVGGAPTKRKTDVDRRNPCGALRAIPPSFSPVCIAVAGAQTHLPCPGRFDSSFVLRGPTRAGSDRDDDDDHVRAAHDALLFLTSAGLPCLAATLSLTAQDAPDCGSSPSALRCTTRTVRGSTAASSHRNIPQCRQSPLTGRSHSRTAWLYPMTHRSQAANAHKCTKWRLIYKRPRNKRLSALVRSMCSLPSSCRVITNDPDSRS